MPHVQVVRSPALRSSYCRFHGVGRCRRRHDNRHGYAKRVEFDVQPGRKGEEAQNVRVI